MSGGHGSKDLALAGGCSGCTQVVAQPAGVWVPAGLSVQWLPLPLQKMLPADLILDLMAESEGMLWGNIVGGGAL